MKRLVIEHGGRVTHHELGDDPVTIGRDPGCDLYFADQRLSRRHCRVEATPDGLRFEDLGSRNGSFVDGERVETVTLKPNQSVRLGGLVLGYEDDAPTSEPSKEDEDATVMLDTGAADEEKTVMVTSPPPEPTSKRTETQTPEQPPTPPEQPPTPPEQPTPPDAPKESFDETVILPKKSEDQEAGLPKTRMLDAESLGKDVAKEADDTMLLPRDAEPPPAPPAPGRPVLGEGEPPLAAEKGPVETGWLASLSWSAKLLFLVSGVALVVYLTLALPLVRTLGNALREESLRRGRSLLMLAAASNGLAVGEGRIRDVSVDAVLREERVKDAFLVDLEGNVLAPSSRADETVTAIDGIEAELADIRTFYLGRRGSDYVMVEPLLHRSRRVGLAVLVYEAASASASWATAVLFLSFLVLLLGVLSALVLGKRMTLEPLSSFRDDIEAVVKGDADHVPPRQAFAELSDLATSVNRLIARALTAPSALPASAVPPPRPSERRERPQPEGRKAPPAHAPSPAKARPETAPRAEPSPTSSSKRPVTAAVRAQPDADAARFWVDENFIVVRADEEAAAFVGASAAEMEGKHLIEAVADQKLLEAILDAVNALEELPASETTADLPGGSKLQITASKDEGTTVVSLHRL